MEHRETRIILMLQKKIVIYQQVINKTFMYKSHSKNNKINKNKLNFQKFWGRHPQKNWRLKKMIRLGALKLHDVHCTIYKNYYFHSYTTSNMVSFAIDGALHINVYETLWFVTIWRQ